MELEGKEEGERRKGIEGKFSQSNEDSWTCPRKSTDKSKSSAFACLWREPLGKSTLHATISQGYVGGGVDSPRKARSLTKEEGCGINIRVDKPFP